MNKILILLILFFTNNIYSTFAQLPTGEEIYSKISNAVVIIYTYDKNGKTLSQGSGVIINEKGLIYTNYHVFAGANKLIVKHKGNFVDYEKIVGIDVQKDILILKFKANSLESIKIANSDLIKVGQKIYAIGSPLGFENTMTEGLVSGLRYNKEEDKNYIQISAAISHGSSGGAVVNSNGELIGISSATIAKGQNLNFAIPVNDFITAYRKLGIPQNEIDASDFLMRGINNSRNRNPDSAIINYEKAISIDPENPKIWIAYINLAYAYGQKKIFEKALLNFKRVIQLKPLMANAYTGIGMVYDNLNKKDSALLYLKKGISVDSNDYRAYFYYGRFLTVKDDNLAIEYFKKVISINPNFVEAYLSLSDAYERLDNLDMKKYYLSKALELKSELKK